MAKTGAVLHPARRDPGAPTSHLRGGAPDPRAAGRAGGGGPNIDRAVGPAAAVLKVFDAVHGLEPPLLVGAAADLPGYVAVVGRLEEALRFLADNCGLAAQWLQHIVA